MKLTFEDKKEICRLYKEEFLSYPKISKMFKVGETTVKRIINRCKEHGEESLRHPAKQRIFSADFKMMIINKVYEGEAKEALAVKYSLAGPGTIASWMHKYEEFGYNGLVSKRTGRPKKNMNQKVEDKQIDFDMSSPLTDPERAEFEELKKKYATLKKAKEQTDMENDILKKLDALIQKRQKKEEK